MSLEFVHEVLHTVAHHQCYQMVDLLTQCCRKPMGGLNPYALPYAPPTKQSVEKSNAPNMRNKNDNVKSSKWHVCKKTKGRRCINKNKNKTEKETKGVVNRFSRLQDMVKDNNEVTEVIEKAVEEDKLRNTIKNKNEENKHDVDSV